VRQDYGEGRLTTRFKALAAVEPFLAHLPWQLIEDASQQRDHHSKDERRPSHVLSALQAQVEAEAAAAEQGARELLSGGALAGFGEQRCGASSPASSSSAPPLPAAAAALLLCAGEVAEEQEEEPAAAPEFDRSHFMAAEDAARAQQARDAEEEQPLMQLQQLVPIWLPDDHADPYADGSAPGAAELSSRYPLHGAGWGSRLPPAPCCPLHTKVPAAAGGRSADGTVGAGVDGTYPPSQTTATFFVHNSKLA
jgi:hypothetical protein